MGETQPDLKQPPEGKDAQEVPPEILEEHIQSSIRDYHLPESPRCRSTWNGSGIRNSA